MGDLILPLKREYFEQIKRGEKPEEFRLCTPYWAKRLEGREYDRVVLTLGYPAKDDSERRLARPWGALSSGRSRIRILGMICSKFMQLM